jgi:hypothetical protein
MLRGLVGLLALCGLWAGVATAESEGGLASPWALPAPGACAPEGGLRLATSGEDAPPLPFRPGDVFTVEEIEVLKDFLPPDFWAHRVRFFYEGMHLLIGPCFADYGPPEFYREATRTLVGQAQITENGGLKNYTAGRPFPADTIAATDPQAATKWAWNLEHRYQGAGFFGPFRTADMVGRNGRAEPFVGEIFKAQLSFRADRAKKGYAFPGAKSKHWVAGGIFTAPFDARHYAWRQYRDVRNMTEAGRSDDLHACLPDWRRVRRMAASNVEGLYMPSFSVGVTQAQAIAGIGGGTEGAAGSGGGGAASAPVSSITTKRSGFEGLAIRPVLYGFRLLGVQDILTPINASQPAFPVDAERHFGPWGLSFASDTWDLRRAVAIEGHLKHSGGDDAVARLILYIDVQTGSPLYYMSFDSRGASIDVGMFVGRWSEKRKNYPRWPDDPDRPIRVIDPVGAAFANIGVDGGWRRESWTIVATPPPDRELKRQLSVNDLTKRR